MHEENYKYQQQIRQLDSPMLDSSSSSKYCSTCQVVCFGDVKEDHDKSPFYTSKMKYVVNIVIIYIHATLIELKTFFLHWCMLYA